MKCIGVFKQISMPTRKTIQKKKPTNMKCDFNEVITGMSIRELNGRLKILK